MKPLIECSNLGYSVGNHRLVHNVSLAVHPGDIVAVVGANGAGKSTLVRLLSGDLSPTHGEIRVNGEPLASVRARELALRRAVLPQRSTIEFAFSVREIVTMGRSPHLSASRAHRPADQPDGRSDEVVVEECLQRAGIGHLAERAYPSLSGGEQARTCFARVLAQEAPLILLDEPTAALDIRYQHLVLAETRRLARQGCGVVAVLHDLNLAAGYATRIAMMHQGELVALGCPRQVLDGDTLSRVYGHPVDVVADPATGSPLVVPRALMLP